MLHEGLHPYPTDLATSTLVVVADALRGNIPDAKAAFHHSWHVVGYFGGKWDIHPPLIGDAANVKALTDAEAASWLEKAASSKYQSGNPVEDVKAIPWAVIIPVILSLIERLWPRK